MSYQFTPLTDEELESSPLVKDGDYKFAVIKSTRKTSKSGNPMAEIIINIWDDQGKAYSIFDYLVFSNVNLNIKKVKHFCDTAGLKEEYKKGDIPEDLDGYCGTVRIGTQEPMQNPNGGFYPRKNVVMDYIDSLKAETKVASSDEFFDDSIPF